MVSCTALTVPSLSYAPAKQIIPDDDGCLLHDHSRRIRLWSSRRRGKSGARPHIERAHPVGQVSACGLDSTWMRFPPVLISVSLTLTSRTPLS